MENNDLSMLIEAFTQYRDLLRPVQQGLAEFADTYDATKAEIAKLGDALGSDMQTNLDKIYKTLSSQAEKSSDLSSRIDKLVKLLERYSQSMSSTVSLIEKTEQKLNAVNDLEQRAETQIAKLEQTLEERRRGYNIKELERTIEGYNQNVAKMNDYINKDVGSAIAENGRILSDIKAENAKMYSALENGNKELENLLTDFSATSQLIKKTVESEAVNEQYVFDILDKWAASRKVKIKRND